MGLDVMLGGIPRVGDPEYDGLRELLEDVLKQARLTLPSESDEKTNQSFGRAYPLHLLAEFCRAEGLPFENIKAITCSFLQMIVPIDFPIPVPEFATKKPGDYKDLRIPDGYGMQEEEYHAKQDLQDAEKFPPEGYTAVLRCPRYPYYLITPPENVFLLSSQQLLREAVEFLERFAPGYRSKDFDWDSKDNHPYTDEAAYLHRCCRSSIIERKVLWFSG